MRLSWSTMFIQIYVSFLKVGLDKQNFKNCDKDELIDCTVNKLYITVQHVARGNRWRHWFLLRSSTRTFDLPRSLELRLRPKTKSEEEECFCQRISRPQKRVWHQRKELFLQVILTWMFQSQTLFRFDFFWQSLYSVSFINKEVFSKCISKNIFFDPKNDKKRNILIKHAGHIILP